MRQKSSELIPVAQAALPLCASVERVKRWIQVGRLRGRIEGGRWYAERSDVERLRREQQERAPAPAA